MEIYWSSRKQVWEQLPEVGIMLSYNWSCFPEDATFNLFFPQVDVHISTNMTFIFWFASLSPGLWLPLGFQILLVLAFVLIFHFLRRYNISSSNCIKAFFKWNGCKAEYTYTFISLASAAVPSGSGGAAWLVSGVLTLWPARAERTVINFSLISSFPDVEHFFVRQHAG